MPALSFDPRFVAPIQVGLGLQPKLVGTDYIPKRQTVRNTRKDGRPPARPGDDLYLYCRQRHPQGFLIGTATCVNVLPIIIKLRAERSEVHILAPGCNLTFACKEAIAQFAQMDGFGAWKDLEAFWAEHHPGVKDFVGWIIYWEPLK